MKKKSIAMMVLCTIAITNALPLQAMAKTNTTVNEEVTSTIVLHGNERYRYTTKIVNSGSKKEKIMTMTKAQAANENKYSERLRVFCVCNLCYNYSSWLDW